jgi:branched-chain amino acid transport system substrate-binding protein
MTPSGASEPIGVKLDDDMMSASAQEDKAIRRGIVWMIDEVNDARGVLGRKFELHICDHRENSARSIDNIEDLAGIQSVVAVVGGIHTLVVMG